MKDLRRIFLRFLSLFTNSRAEAELDREIAAHLQLLEDDFLCQGMTPKEARSAARRAYGGVEQAKQLHRDERAFQGLATIVMDIRYTLRQLRKSPGFTLTAILMLAFGIGATTAVFSIVEGVLLRPLPFADPDRLVILGDDLVGSHWTRPTVTPPDVRNYMRDTHSFLHLGGYQRIGRELSGVGDPVHIDATRMSGEIFSALATAPLMGRWFTQQEDEQHQPVVVLSYAMWRKRFHGDEKILGTKILLDRQPYLVIGIMPRDFEFPLVPGHLNSSELWIPLSLRPEEFTAGYAASWNFRMVGRLKPGVAPAQAQRDAQLVAEETMRNYLGFMRSLRIQSQVRLLHEDTVTQARPLVHTLLIAVATVLLIACANLAGLLLVRSIRRRREIAVRLALGASTGMLLRQALVESLVLSIAGGLIGLVFAAACIRIGISLLPETLPRIREIALDWPVVGFALALAILTGLICGLAPAFAAIRTSVNDTLKEGGRTGTAGSGHGRLRSALVIAEIAVALVLLTASGLLLRSFEKMRQIDPGFRVDHTLTAYYVLPKERYAIQSGIDNVTNDLLRSLRQLPGVKAAGITSSRPGSGNNGGIAITVEGVAPRKDAELNMATVSLVQGDSFQALGIRLLRGRVFTESDRADSQLVAIVNRKLAEHYWPGDNPLGKRLRRGMPETPTPWLIVVGVVDDVKLGSADGETAEQFYQPVTQQAISEGAFAPAGELTGTYGCIVLHTETPSEQLENPFLAAVRKIDPQLPLVDMQTMESVISENEAPRLFNTVLISSFAIIALLLAVLGIYSVIAFSVALREQELAIRMALGCQRKGILHLVLTSAVKLGAVGCLLGLLTSTAVSHLLRAFLFGVSPFDPLVLTLSAVAMLSFALAASTLPAMRAAKINPIIALRGD
ncbi:ABC transporter permease [Edaphobacter modestus]|uniref:Putative permease n=1 Tax=Edaphobacter modestus TaxID=388466 RepID=A0A4Q7YGA1_9BACT|nr:ABC transporter permease [Edaphobacter modestus]RZU35673.1 putative permease [Edaphobacter modestus]